MDKSLEEEKLKNQVRREDGCLLSSRESIQVITSLKSIEEKTLKLEESFTKFEDRLGKLDEKLDQLNIDKATLKGMSAASKFWFKAGVSTVIISFVLGILSVIFVITGKISNINDITTLFKW